LKTWRRRVSGKFLIIIFNIFYNLVSRFLDLSRKSSKVLGGEKQKKEKPVKNAKDEDKNAEIKIIKT